MIDFSQPNTLVLAAVVVAVLLVGWWLLRRGSNAPRRERRPDVLDEGQAPAQRNQALIDSAPAATITPPPLSGAMAGLGEVVAVAAQDEIEELAAQPAPEPAAPTPTPTAAAAAAEGDDLSKIKGLGPKLRALLPTLGITSYAQIAALSEADLDALDAKLGTFAGRPRRDNWVEQAKFLAAGDTAGFEGQFGKL